MLPPLHDESVKVGAMKIHRVRDDANVEPTEYAVFLPAEYHPLRNYPAVVALHSGNGPESAIAWWAPEATRRGYIVVAPEYNVPGAPKDYRYTTSEHAAVELALRDARRRYAIDGDRVFLGGQLNGGHMAWDFGLSHPDLFAGVAVVSGLPGKYVIKNLANVERDRGSLYVALGDLAPASNELVFSEMLKPLIVKAFDVTYVEYYKRGLEDLPEEAPAIFDWMDRRHRDAYPKSFSAVASRDSDDRYYGVVIREFQPGRTTAPEAVEPLGNNLNPASIKMTSSSLSNLLNLTINGVKRLDVWVSPKLIDFKKRMEVRINGKTFFKAVAKPNLAPLLEDLRIRGDRQQVYWLKVSAG
jgi:pimeloyl-ACP methyl ester carboxylesterase